MNKIKYISISLLLIFFLISCDKIGGIGRTKEKEIKGTRIFETGELAAIEQRSFNVERFKVKIIGLLPHGEKVKAGDSIIQLDPAEFNKQILDLETDLENQIAALEKMKVNHDNQNKDLESNLKSETASFELRKLEMESTRFESERTQEVKKMEFQQAEINFNRVKRKIELSKISQMNDLKIQNIRIARLKEDIRRTQEIIPKLTIRTPIDGIFQIAKSGRGDQLIKLGDELYRGNQIGSVPDLSWMKVNTTISEMDFLKIREGQKVIVRLDALPDVPFEAEVNYIGKLCRPKEFNSKQKVFDVEVNLLVSDERLKPGMTVSCEYIID